MNNHPALARYITRELGGDSNNTSLQGGIKCGYADLVAIFGPPNSQGDGYKVDAEWTLTFTKFGMYKQVATIYNYKDGKNYLKEEGKAVEDITNWHIGGFPQDGGEVVGYIASMVIHHYQTKLKGHGAG